MIERVIKIEERGEILTRGDLDSLLLAGGDESLRVFVGAILQENIVTSDGAIVSGWCPALLWVTLELTTGSLDRTVHFETVQRAPHRSTTFLAKDTWFQNIANTIVSSFEDMWIVVLLNGSPKTLSVAECIFIKVLECDQVELLASWIIDDVIVHEFPTVTSTFNLRWLDFGNTLFVERASCA